MELGVRLAFFLDQNQLRAEAEEGEGALEGRQLVGAREILAFFGPQGEIGPVGLVEAAGDGGRGSHAETQGQRVGSREATPGSRETMRAQAGLSSRQPAVTLTDSAAVACQRPSSENDQRGLSRCLECLN